MDTNKSESFNEIQSIRVIREMIQVSQKKMKSDGILLIVWGWIYVINYFFLNYLPGIIMTTHRIMQVVRFLRVALPIGGLAYTLYYIYKQSQKATTYIGVSLRYVWVSLFLSMVLVNLIQFNVLHKINFELQHPIFMVFISFAIVVTGGILRYKLLIAGGIFFGLMAYVCSYLPLQEQLLGEAIAWIIAFIIPGHFLYSKRNS